MVKINADKEPAHNKPRENEGNVTIDATAVNNANSYEFLIDIRLDITPTNSITEIAGLFLIFRNIP